MATDADRTRRWYSEVWKPGGESTVRELMADRLEGYMEGADVHTRDEFLAERAKLLGAFPDLHIEVDDVIEQGSKTVARWHVTATHEGASLGFPPCNKRVTFRGMTWLEFKDGRIVRGWDSWNLGGLLAQLGVPAAR
jgi:steroid delta-isomerase-like uncharacterized protein